jgi:hypothetical protein
MESWSFTRLIGLAGKGAGHTKANQIHIDMNEMRTRWSTVSAVIARMLLACLASRSA